MRFIQVLKMWCFTYWFPFDLLAFFLTFLSSLTVAHLFLSRWYQSPPVRGRDPVWGGGRVSSPPRACAWCRPRVWRGRRGWPTADPGWGCSWSRKWSFSSTSCGEGNLDQTDGFHHVLRRFCCRLGQRVAVSLPLLQEWRRWASGELWRILFYECSNEHYFN